MPEAVAKHYAEALYLATSYNRVLLERVGTELEQMVELSKEYPELAAYFDSRVVDRDTERRFLGELADALEMTEDMQGFLRSVVKRNRFYLLKDILRAFHEILERGNPRDEAYISTPFPLTEIQSKLLKDRLETIMKKHIELRVKIDPTLIAGWKVEVGHRIYDASLGHRLQLLKQRLLGKDIV